MGQAVEHNSTEQGFRQQRGRVSHDIAKKWLERNGFRIERENWRVPKIRSSGAGEVDLVASRLHKCGSSLLVVGDLVVSLATLTSNREWWIFEVKTQSAEAALPLIGWAQIHRLRAARRWLSCELGGRAVRFGLIWVNPRTGAVEFLENPC